MKKQNLLLLLFVSFSFLGLCAGGTTPAAAFSVPITLPFYNSAGQTTAGNDVSNPAGFVSAYTTGYDWFYYFCPTSSGNITTTISYTTTSGGVSPSISIWNGVPGSGGTLVSSITSPGDNTVDGVLSIEATVVAGTCYYIMIDNWPTPNGFTYDISVYLSPINAACTNIGFENNNFSGWIGTTGIITSGISTDPYPVYEPTGFTTSSTQHTIYTTGNDPVVGAALPRVCPSLTTNSMRLGDGTGTGALGASLEQKFTVDASNALFTYYYAVVFQDNGHDPFDQPIFKVDVLDCSGNPITCGDYLVVANAGASGFVNVPGTITYYKPWTPVFLDLSPYIGSCVTVRFITEDCAQGGHYGYAYIDAVCNPIQITGTSTICTGESTTLSAPAGGATYSWNVQGNPTVIGTSQAISLSPLVTTTYECVVTSVTNCQTIVTSSPITVNPSPTITGTLSCCITGTSLLTGSASPNASDPWTSSNTAVATISSIGLVTGLTAGTSIITYKNTNGCIITAIFTVNPNPTITGTLSICIGGTSQLTGSETADLTTPWTSSNPSIATISSTGLITALTLGTTTITYKNLNGCTITAIFTTTSNPNITNPGPQNACDSYTLPTITGTNLTGNQSYYNNSQALGGTLLTGPITTTQTVWIYDAQGLCKDEENFLVTITISPVITNNPGALSVCSNYALPVILGTNLTGNQNYYNNSQALGGIILTGPLTTTQTVWIYDVNGICFDEENYLVTINTTPPNITNPGPVSACNTFTLPTITGINLTGNENYYNNSQALGGTIISGAISTTQTVWIYDVFGTCSDEESFLVTVNTPPSITNPGPQSVCDSYIPPTILGTNLSGNQEYYNNSQALGGTVISGAITSTQTVWIYDVNSSCSDEENFFVTVNNTPSITNPGSQTACDSFTLPTILGTNLTGNQNYYNNSQALGGTIIFGAITTTQTVWIYDAEGTCSDEESFLVTINITPAIINPGPQTVCDSYTLPTILGTNLTGNQEYYNNSQALGGTVISGTITTTQTIWIYDVNATCSDEVSFLVTINNTPSITNPGPQTVCDSYTLPTILGTNLTGNQQYYNNYQAFGGTLISGPITSTQTVWIYDAEGSCSDEESFLVTINLTPSITNPDPQTKCDSYTLPTITGSNLSGNQNYYNNSQALGGTIVSGEITTTQTVWIYDSNGTCTNEVNFLVTINPTPIIVISPDKLNGCAPLTVVFTNNSSPASDSVFWTFGDGTSVTLLSDTETITHTFNTVGCFDITLTSSTSGCTNSLSETQLICTYETAIADFSVNRLKTSLIDPTFEFTNLSNNTTIYNWDFGDESTSIEENPTHEYVSEPAKYSVTLLANNVNNCPDTKIIEVEVVDELIFYIPNTFTPDGDNINQVFTPIFKSGFDPYNFSMYIFDRWGTIIFETHDSTKGWHGTFGIDGTLCQDDTYTWKIIYSELETKKESVLIGHVNLLR